MHKSLFTLVKLVFKRVIIIFKTLDTTCFHLQIDGKTKWFLAPSFIPFACST